METSDHTKQIEVTSGIDLWK